MIMINLLPPLEKKKRIQEKSLKLTWILGILVIASILCFSLILLSIKFYITNQLSAEEDLIESEKQSNVQVQTLRARTSSLNQTLSELNDFYQNQFAVSDFLERISVLLPPSVYLESFSYQAKSSQVIISGYAHSVDRAHEIRERFRGQEDFKEISLTLPDWLQPTGIDFRASFVLQK